jgi:hypothetical protein
LQSGIVVPEGADKVLVVPHSGDAQKQHAPPLLPPPPPLLLLLLHPTP